MKLRTLTFLNSIFVATVVISVTLVAGVGVFTSPTSNAFAQGQPQENWITNATVSSSSITIADTSLKIAGAHATKQSAPSSDCPTTSCANVVAGNQMFVFEEQPLSTPTIDPSTVHEGFKGLIGVSAAQEGAGVLQASSQSSTVDVYLNDAWLDSLPAADKLSIEADLQLLASTLQPLATTAGDGHMVALHKAADEIADDVTSRPIARIITGVHHVEVQRRPQDILASAKPAPLTFVFLPTDDGAGLLTVDSQGASVTTGTNGVDAATSDVEQSTATVTLLPGLIESIPISTSQGPIKAGATFEAVQPLLSEQAHKILGQIEDSQASAMKVDAKSHGLVQHVTAASGTTCFIGLGSLQTCIEIGAVQRNNTTDSHGIGIAIAPARIGTLRQHMLVSGNQAFAGVNTQFPLIEASQVHDGLPGDAGDKDSPVEDPKADPNADGQDSSAEGPKENTADSQKPAEGADGADPQKPADAADSQKPADSTDAQKPADNADDKKPADDDEPLPVTGGTDIPLPLLLGMFILGFFGFVALRKRANEL